MRPDPRGRPQLLIIGSQDDTRVTFIVFLLSSLYCLVALKVCLWALECTGGPKVLYYTNRRRHDSAHPAAAHTRIGGPDTSNYNDKSEPMSKQPGIIARWILDRLLELSGQILRPA
jgi:hypothetical protein